MENKGGNYFEFISDFGISIWAMKLFHETGETIGTVGTLLHHKNGQNSGKRRLLDRFFGRFEQKKTCFRPKNDEKTLVFDDFLLFFDGKSRVFVRFLP
ncbi:hypothetical protein [Mucilaginibacter sp.]